MSGITVKWNGLDLEVVGNYEPSSPGSLYEPPSGDFEIDEIWYTPHNGQPERQRALEDAFAEEIANLAYEACEAGDTEGYDHD
jgi:hypothetical protein